MKHVYTITKDDIHKTRIKIIVCKYCGKSAVIPVRDIMGPVQKVDIGKRIYVISQPGLDVVYGVENQEQLEARLKL